MMVKVKNACAPPSRYANIASSKPWHWCLKSGDDTFIEDLEEFLKTMDSNDKEHEELNKTFRF